MELLKWTNFTLGIIALVFLIKLVSSSAVIRINAQETTLKDILKKEVLSIHVFRQKIKDKHVILILGDKSSKSEVLEHFAKIGFLQHSSGTPVKESEEVLRPPAVYPTAVPGKVLVYASGWGSENQALERVIDAVYLKQVKYAETSQFLALDKDVVQLSNEKDSCFLTATKASVLQWTREELQEFIQKATCTPKFTLSKISEQVLSELYTDYVSSSYFHSEVSKVLKDFEDLYKDKWIFASYDEELNANKLALEKVKSLVQQQNDSNLTDLRDVQTSLKVFGFSLSYEFTNDFEIITLLDDSSMIEDQIKNTIQQHYKSSLAQLQTEINELLQKITDELNTRRSKHINFPIKNNFLATAYTITRAILSKVYGVTSDVYETVSQTVKQPIPQAVLAVLRAESDKGLTLDKLCSAAEKAADAVVMYVPERLAVGGAVGVGVAAGGDEAYVLYQEIYGPRIQTRRAQHRQVYSWM